MTSAGEMNTKCGQTERLGMEHQRGTVIDAEQSKFVIDVHAKLQRIINLVRRHANNGERTPQSVNRVGDEINCSASV